MDGDDRYGVIQFAREVVSKGAMRHGGADEEISNLDYAGSRVKVSCGVSYLSASVPLGHSARYTWVRLESEDGKTKTAQFYGTTKKREEKARRAIREFVYAAFERAEKADRQRRRWAEERARG